MRLLDTETFTLREMQDGPPDHPYAILSHRWGKAELSFQDLRDLKRGRILVRDMSPDLQKSHAKVLGALALARRDGYRSIWVDTCCIDKSSSAELSEAINSMYRWYADAAVCYAYLADVDPSEDIHPASSSFRQSSWFTRGWTLQELIAPREVRFYAGPRWTFLGAKSDAAFCRLLAAVTDVDISVLRKFTLPRTVSVAVRMRWASRRRTTRVEDVAYALLGLFDVNMPLLYGEGDKAFLRLQEEILRRTTDQSLLAWHLRPAERTAEADSTWGALAKSPGHFRGVQTTDPLPPLEKPDIFPWAMTSWGLHVRLFLIPASSRSTNKSAAASTSAALGPAESAALGPTERTDGVLAVLECSGWTGSEERCPAIRLLSLGADLYLRAKTDEPVWVRPPEWLNPAEGWGYKTIFLMQNSRYYLPKILVPVRAPEAPALWEFVDVYPREGWDPASRVLTLARPRLDRMSAVLRFAEPDDGNGGRKIDVLLELGFKKRTWGVWYSTSTAVCGGADGGGSVQDLPEAYGDGVLPQAPGAHEFVRVRLVDIYRDGRRCIRLDVSSP